MRTLLAGALLVTAVYAVFCLLVYLSQTSMVYLPTRAIETTPTARGWQYEPVRFAAADGVMLSGWFIPAERSRATLLFFHGNAGNISHRLESIAIFRRLGLDVFIFDYRGYGESEGCPDEQGTYRDAEAAWRYLVEQRGIDASRIVLFGRSLGGAVAAWLAARERPCAVVLESTFSSAPDFAAELYPWLPVRWLLRFRYDSLARLPAIRAPVLVVHSPQDEIIPFHHAERLYAAAAGPKQLLRLRGDHNGGFLLSGEDYVRGLAAFLDRCGVRPGS